MKLMLDIEDDKAPFIIEVLKNFKFVKTKPLSTYKYEVLEGLKEGIEEMKLIQSGKLKETSARDLFDEL